MSAYLQAFAAGEFPDMRFAVTDFARHYRGYSQYFPQFLTTVIARLVNPSHRAALTQNLTEESGSYPEEDLEKLRELGLKEEWFVGVRHPKLFQRFSGAVGIDASDTARVHVEVESWREMLLLVLEQGTVAEAVGALGLGTETVVRPMYEYITKGLDRFGALSPRDTVFFPLHTAVDDEHQATLKAIAADLCLLPDGRKELEKGMVKALVLRDSFWNWLYSRAFGRPKG